MVSPRHEMGIVHVIPAGTKIAHSTVNNRKTFGRTADLLCIWATREQGLVGAAAGSLRILISALLESLPEGDLSPSRIEMAAFDGQIVIAVRMECGDAVVPGEAEKTFTQHWLNSNQMQILRRSIDPRDRIEVRYQKGSSLVEWRVIRSIQEGEMDPNISSFAVFEDPRESLQESGSDYVDLGDLPFGEWFENAFALAKKNSHESEIRIKGESSLADQDYARIKVGQELHDIEESVVRGYNDEKDQEGDDFGSSALRMVDELLKKVERKEAVEENLTSMINQLKVEARERQKEVNQWKRKYQKTIDLLSHKEIALYSQATKLRALEKMHEEVGSRSGTKPKDPFKEKAIQMYEKLKVVTEQNESLRIELAQLKAQGAGRIDGDYESGTTIRTNTDDLERKLERLQKALDLEKTKTSGLLERALNAEREAQASTHLISDLEAKVETTLKNSMQYKKEIDSMKQKMVQGDAEKNRIQNELLKAQAHIQTLMKRQAS